MKQAYSWADVSFDRWFYESEMDEPSVKLVKEYQQKGLFVEDQGAIGVDLSEHKLGFCIVLKSDGTGMYSTKDILLAKRKFEEFKIEKKAPKLIFKGRWFIFFKKSMANPCKAITYQRYKNPFPAPTINNCGKQE